MKGYSHKIPSNAGPAATAGLGKSASLTKVGRAKRENKDGSAAAYAGDAAASGATGIDVGMLDSVSSSENLLKGAAATAHQGNSKVAASKAAQAQNQGAGGQRGQVSKVSMQNLAKQAKDDLQIKKRLIREKNEKALCGGYELIYPFVTYEEEERIKEKVIVLKNQGQQARSVKTLMGMDAPRTLKEKLAELKEN